MIVNGNDLSLIIMSGRVLSKTLVSYSVSQKIFVSVAQLQVFTITRRGFDSLPGTIFEWATDSCSES